MKNIVIISLVMLLPLMNFHEIYGQCIPDATGCVDVLLPGEICPDTLPPGELGVEYNQTVTIWPPASYFIEEFSTTITIIKIQIISVDSLPPGLGYEVNAEDLYPDTAYCSLISGTPTDTGLFSVVITVQPYIINPFGIDTIMWEPQSNDTSVFIRINSPSNIDDSNYEKFYVFNESNPFSVKTRIGFVTLAPGEVELYIFDILGKLVYNEIIVAKRGRNYFDFTGENLISGIYIFSVKNNENTYSRRLVKSR